MHFFCPATVTLAPSGHLHLLLAVQVKCVSKALPYVALPPHGHNMSHSRQGEGGGDSPAVLVPPTHTLLLAPGLFALDPTDGPVVCNLE